MAQGHNIGFNKISSILFGINANTLQQMINWFFTAPNLQEANDRIIDHINRLALSNVFRYETNIVLTSSDGRKAYVALIVCWLIIRSNILVMIRGVTIYTFIDDKQALFYSTVISASEREAAYVLDGLLHNKVVKSSIHSTDTHG